MQMWPMGATQDHAGYPVHVCSACGGAWMRRDDVTPLLEGFALLSDARHTDDVHEHDEEEARRPEHLRDRQLSSMSGSSVTYRRCPHCQQLMRRRNFGAVSGVIVDTCPHHGTFFDAGELEALVQFAQTGGLAFAEQIRQGRRRRTVERLMERVENAANVLDERVIEERRIWASVAASQPGASSSTESTPLPMRPCGLDPTFEEEVEEIRRMVSSFVKLASRWISSIRG